MTSDWDAQIKCVPNKIETISSRTIYNNYLNKNISLYPNPNNGTFAISNNSNSDILKVVVYYFTGTPLQTNDFKNQFIENYTNDNVTSGVYFNHITTDNGVEISNELIDALINEQGENFISLYPNPFQTDLLIQYELEEQTTSSVEMYDLSGTFYTKILDAQMQEAGDKIFYYDGSHLQPDQYYVVKVTAGNKVYTKLIIKR